MLNNELFIKRLLLIQQHYQLNSAELADKIDVQRSSISHILSGRNKPSLDFILKLSQAFKDLSLNWLINGGDTFPPKEIIENKPSESNLFSTVNTFSKNDRDNSEIVSKKNSIVPTINDETIEKIVIFYKDGSFKSYHPKA